MPLISGNLPLRSALRAACPRAKEQYVALLAERLPLLYRGFRPGLSQVRSVLLPKGSRYFGAPSGTLRITHVSIDAHISVPMAWDGAQDTLYIVEFHQ